MRLRSHMTKGGLPTTMTMVSVVSDSDEQNEIHMSCHSFSDENEMPHYCPSATGELSR